MLPVVDKFKDMGTVVFGKVESGQARKGQSLILMPNKTSVTVDQLWSDDDEVTAVGPGENVKIKLKGIEEEDVSSGFILTDPSNPCKVGKIFDAQVRTIINYFVLMIVNDLDRMYNNRKIEKLQVAILEHKSIICAGYSAVMHIHTVAEEITVKV